MADWQKDFKLKQDLRQREVYAFENELRQQERLAPTLENIITRTFQVLQGLGMTVGANIESEQYLKAALKAGWIETPACEVARITGADKRERTVFLLGGVDIDEMHPGKVRWYGRQISALYNLAVAPPDQNS